MSEERIEPRCKTTGAGISLDGAHNRMKYINEK
jgi:hypothetical protein